MRHRTALITAGSLALVVFAAAIAVGANVGILNAADAKPVGTLSAATPMTAAQPQPQMVSATPPAPVPPQKYLIKKAGQVSVAKSGSGVRLVSVDANHGWRWSLTQTNNHRLTVTFKKGKNIYTFKAVVKGGAIAARVDHPVTKTVQSAAGPSSGGSSGGTYYAPPAPTVASAAPAAAPAPKPASSEDSQPNGGGEQDD